MSKRKKFFLLLLLCFIIVILFLYLKFFYAAIIVTAVLAVIMLLLVLMFSLNAAYIKTNHWKKFCMFEKQFITNVGYRDNLIRNIEIVNLGSNPSKYGFFYEKVKGMNWATGSQGFPMDYEILKYNHSLLKEGGYVLIPIMPFSAVSQYLETKPKIWSDDYYVKFVKVIDKSQVHKLPNGKKLVYKLRFPLIFNLKRIKYLFHDESEDNVFFASQQSMMEIELEKDAERWLSMWLDEFDASSLDDFCTDKYLKYENASSEIVKQIIDFCLYRGYRPVLITIPMSLYLARKFPDEVRQRLLYDFAVKCNEKKILFLDYMFDDRFSDASFYEGSFFLNLDGRKKFTRQVLKDLGLLK